MASLSYVLLGTDEPRDRVVAGVGAALGQVASGGSEEQWTVDGCLVVLGVDDLRNDDYDDPRAQGVRYELIVQGPHREVAARGVYAALVAATPWAVVLTAHEGDTAIEARPALRAAPHFARGG